MTMFFKSVVVVLIAILFIDEATANTCPRLVRLKKSPVCFGARSNKYGRVTYPRNIFVSSFLFVHRTGSVTCNKKQYSYWGCFPNHHGLVVILTDHQIRILAGYTSSVFCPRVLCSSEAPLSFANTELRLWYGEDLRGFIENDKGGKTCADVYDALA